MTSHLTQAAAWPVQDAKARFSEMLDRCLESGPQLVSRRGIPAAVLVALEDYDRLRALARPDLKSLLLSDVARDDDLIPVRAVRQHRSALPFD